MTISTISAHTVPVPQWSSFQFKGRLHTLTTLQLLKANLEQLDKELRAKIAEAPHFFEHIPVVIDIKTSDPVDFENLLAVLKKNDLIPVGLCGGTLAQQAAAKSTGLAVFSDASGQLPDKVTSLEPRLPKPASRLITEPVRSGQQIYAQGADLIVLAPVSHGAEILADGSIHVYAPLRGRALAGIMGNADARIFCASLEAELISIAGHYLVSEQLKNIRWKASSQIRCSDGNLHIEPL